MLRNFLIAVSCLPGAAFADDLPANDDAPRLGKITGVIRPAKVVKKITCIDRGYNLPYKVGFDDESGRFTVDAVAAGRRYDLTVITDDGRAFHGVDLSFEEDPLLRLAEDTQREDRKQKPPGPLTDRDRGEINDIVEKVETFEDKRRIMRLAGNHRRATALIELRRTRPFHLARGDEQIRRVELWYFKFQYGGWEKVANAEKVLSRVRAPRRRIEQLMRAEHYLPQLGGILVSEEEPAPRVELNLPGYEVEPTSRPHEKETPTTRPAGKDHP